jgi:hypothetical protein
MCQICKQFVLQTCQFYSKFIIKISSECYIVRDEICVHSRGSPYFCLLIRVINNFFLFAYSLLVFLSMQPLNYWSFKSFDCFMARVLSVIGR